MVLQARTNSSRLPGKALLPLAGTASAVLAGLRAQTMGHQVVLATSRESSDDVLARCAKTSGLEVFRGDLNDVRSRFVQLSRGLMAEDVLVRLTGDCTFPDGELIGLAVNALEESGDHIVRSMEDPRIPFGLSVEAFRVKALRESLSDVSPASMEHVTPPLIQRQVSFSTFVPLKQDFSALRCALDTAEDYELLQQVFDEVDEPSTIGWQNLVQRLSQVSGLEHEN